MDERVESATEQVLKRRYYLYIFVAFSLFLATVAQLNQLLLRHASWLQVDVGGSEPGHFSADTKHLLRNLDRRLSITFFVSNKNEMPSQLKGVEGSVVRFLQALRSEAPATIEYRVLDPGIGDQQGTFFAARKKVSSVSVRRVVHDETSEQTVWSSLVLELEGHPAVLIQDIGPAHLPHLEHLVTHHLRAKLAPKPPTFGLVARGQYQMLAHFMAEHGRVIPLDLQRQPQIPREVDVLFWMQPTGATADHIDQLKKFLASGRTALLAGSSYSIGYEFEQSDKVTYHAFRHPPVWEMLLAPFGVRPLPDLLMDGSTGPVPLADSDGSVREVIAPFHIRCLPAFYNLKSFLGPARGGLNFVAASALEVNPARVGEAGFYPEVIATTTGNTWVRQLPDAPFSDRDLQPDLKVPKQNLAVLLKPHDPLGGEMVVLGSAAFFQDGIINQPRYAHRVFLRTLLRTLSSPDRLVQARIPRSTPDPLPPLGSGTRFWWRLLIVFLLPGLLISLVFRRYLRTKAPVRSGISRWLVPRASVAVLALIIGVFLWQQRGQFYVDLTKNDSNSLASLTRQRLSTVGPLKTTLIASTSSTLSVRLKRALERTRFLLASMDIPIETRHPAALSRVELDELQRLGLRPFETEIVREDSVITNKVWSGMSVSIGNRIEVIPRLDGRTVDHLEFLLLAAIHRQQSGTAPHVAIVSDLPRLSPAEALEDYHKKGLIPPKGVDVYSDAKSLLRDYGYRVTHVDPQAPFLAPDTEVVIWLQPRRDATSVIEQFSRYLAGGGRAVVALQHFNIQQRQYRGTGFQTVYWPQPQFQDAELYLNLLGVEQVREVLMDQTHHHLQLETQVNRTAIREYDPQKVALPFLIRTVGANYNQGSPITQELGDLLFAWGNRFSFDFDRLQAANLYHRTLITTSERVWSFPWKGGWLPPEIFVAKDFLPPNQPLAATLEGRFPALLTEREKTRVNFHLGEPGQHPGKLVLIGNSEMFKNAYLTMPGFQHDQLLLNVVAHLAYGPEMTQLQARRSSPRGFAYLSPSAKVGWRAIVVGTAPLALLALGFDRYRRRHAPLGMA